jgi:hypothetical protein
MFLQRLLKTGTLMFMSKFLLEADFCRASAAQSKKSTTYWQAPQQRNKKAHRRQTKKGQTIGLSFISKSKILLFFFFLF